MFWISQSLLPPKSYFSGIHSRGGLVIRLGKLTPILTPPFLLTGRNSAMIGGGDIGYDVALHATIYMNRGNIKFIWSPCISDIIRNLPHQDEFDLVVASAGSHVGDCMEEPISRLHQLYQLVSTSGVAKFIWRTEPLPDVQDPAKMIEIAQHARSLWNSTQLIDHQHLMHGRDLGKTRMKGNHPFHFNTDARIALVQHFFKHFQLLDW